MGAGGGKDQQLDDPKYKQHRLTPRVIHVDDRVGSREFTGPLHNDFRLNVREERLAYADFAFLGNGPDPDRPLRIAIERKTLPDLVGSLVKDRLFSHQIPGLLKEYDLIWVVVEGEWIPAQDDAVLVPGFDFINKRKGMVRARFGITYSQIDRWLMTYDVMGGGRLKRWRTTSEWETAYFIADLFRYFDKPWDKHHSQAQIGKWTPGQVPNKVLLSQPNDIMRVAASLPGVGQVIARKAGKYFKSIDHLFQAGPDDWEALGMGRGSALKLCFRITKKVR